MGSLEGPSNQTLSGLNLPVLDAFLVVCAAHSGATVELLSVFHLGVGVQGPVKLRLGALSTEVGARLRALWSEVNACLCVLRTHLWLLTF